LGTDLEDLVDGEQYKLKNLNSVEIKVNILSFTERKSSLKSISGPRYS
jgi:hypothetical protein